MVKSCFPVVTHPAHWLLRIVGQPGVDEDYSYWSEPAQYQVEIEDGVAENHNIFVENMDDRVVDKEETKDKKDYPPLSFVEYAYCLFHALSFSWIVTGLEF